MTNPLRGGCCRSVLVIALALGTSLCGTAHASYASWMEDDAFRLRANTLETLSWPASHDAGMYEQDIELIEISLQNLWARVELTALGLDLLPPVEFGPITGILEGRGVSGLKPILDGLLDAVRAVDSYVCSWACVHPSFLSVAQDWLQVLDGLVTGTVEDNLSIAQNLDVYGQLQNGARMFDLRPKEQHGSFYTHHSQQINKDLSVDFTKTVELGPVTLGKFSFGLGGSLKSLSATGPRLDNVLSDVRRFMQEGHRELVVLKFSHYWAGYNGAGFGPAEYKDLLDLVTKTLGPWLLTGKMLPGGARLNPEERLATTRFADLVRHGGRVLAVFASDTTNGKTYTYVDPAAGIWPISVVETAGDGSYADTDDLDKMREDQIDKWEADTQRRFRLWWTLTCQQGDLKDMLSCSVHELANQANPYLLDFVDGLTIPNGNGNNMNEIWVDFIEETAATQIALELNPLSVDIDINPDAVSNSVDLRPGAELWVAVLSSAQPPFDAPGQIDIGSVRFGPARAPVVRHHFRDVNGDGLRDLVLLFDTRDTGLACQANAATLKGTTYLGDNVVGTNRINVVRCKKKRG